MFLVGAVSFRGCRAVVRLLGGFLPSFRAAPAPNTVQSWLLRVGLHELRRPKEQAGDWVFIIDHTIQLGAWKCLLIVGVRGSVWERLSEPLSHHDVTFITLEPVRKSDGERVFQQLQEATRKVGVPRAILSDHGSDIARGARKFREKHPQTLVLCDIAHQTAIALKRELSTDPVWRAFVKHCGQTQPKVKQTELGHLAPPTQKVKGRYMNLGPLIGWGKRMLKLVDTPESDRPSDVPLARLDEKFGWIRDFRQALAEWEDLQAVNQHVLDYARKKGYHAQAAAELRQRLQAIAGTTRGQRMAASLAQFVATQSQAVRRRESLPASSEVIESLIGKGKRMLGQHSRGGFTKMILGMAASVVRITQQSVREALQAVRHADLHAWCKQHLGISLTAQRRRALPLQSGTKPG